MLMYVKVLSTVPEDELDCSVTALQCVACNIKLTKKLREILKNPAVLNYSRLLLEYRMMFCTNFGIISYQSLV